MSQLWLVSPMPWPHTWSATRQIQGYMFTVPKKMLSDLPDMIGYNPLSHRRILFGIPPAFTGFTRFQLPSILFKSLHSVPVPQRSGSCVELRGEFRAQYTLWAQEAGWSGSQESARATAMIDDEVRQRFYWSWSVAGRNNQNEWDSWHLWALFQSRFYYYLFTWSNNVGSISSSINL